MLNRFLPALVGLFLLVGCSSESSNNPIGMFDSGTGGLTVLEAFLNLDEFNNATGEQQADGIPDYVHEDFIFLADQVNMPYGLYNSKGKGNLLKELVVNDAAFLTQGANSSKIVVIACNTATANALPEVEEYLSDKSIKVIGVINAAVEGLYSSVQDYNERSAVGVMATEGTILSGGYERTIENLFSSRGATPPLVVNHAGLGFAESVDLEPHYTLLSAALTRENYMGPTLGEGEGYIESRLFDRYNFHYDNNALLVEYREGAVSKVQLNSPGNYARFHLLSLIEKFREMSSGLKLSDIILGCTHYPYLVDTMKVMIEELREYNIDGNYIYRELLADEVNFIDPAKFVAIETYIALRDTKLLSKKSDKWSLTTYISVPSPSLAKEMLDGTGGFSFDFKYGREMDDLKGSYVVKRLSSDLIPLESLKRIESRLPLTYSLMKLD